ncbi:LysM peptidoglycan-binding domain-containing protein [Paenibacillus ihuae]|uniref:LysM peptidoglycan-binding domain-containing protein n=1 Tax=Paenibacillus ihuae TaxID=1232431 RepID=UPI0006D55E60|nr:LysM peptidoglycan-binding domain-containing protein [Paenibacillus ihuae]
MLKYSTYRSIYDEARELQSAGDDSASTYVSSLKDSAASLFSMLMKVFVKDNFIKLALVFMLVVSGFTVVGNVFAGSVSSMTQGKRVVVVRGDTLWSIAREHKPDNMRTVVYIEGIKKTSGLNSSDIQAGDVLTLPVY